MPEEHKAVVMAEREATAIAWKQLGAPVTYCLPHNGKLKADESEEPHITDPELTEWRLNPDRQKLNAAVLLSQGVIEVRFFGPDQSLNACFFAACARTGLTARFAIARNTKPVAHSILFKLREDEAGRIHEEYAGFRPRPFTLDGARYGIVINSAEPVKKGDGPMALAMLPGSIQWSDDGVRYDLLVWRGEDGVSAAKPRQTAPPTVEFFQIIRAGAYASILNIIPAKAWESQLTQRVFAEWLARTVRDGAAINANTIFSKASRAIIADQQHAENLLDLICSQRSQDRVETLRYCVETFRLALKRLAADPARTDVSGWGAIAQVFGDDAAKALRGILHVGADSALLEDFADRYLFEENASCFIDKKAFHEGSSGYLKSSDELRLRHAPDHIQTRKGKPIEAWPLFVKSKLRRNVTDVQTYPDHDPGSIIRITRQGATIPNDDYAPEHSRLIFNDWRGLYITPLKTVDAALRAECIEKLNFMLSLVTNRHQGRMDWIKAHLGWTLKHPGQKQQVALVCTGDQGTGKSFLCTTFAQAIFGRYADTASVRALNGQFYIAGYINRLWVSHDEFVSDFDNGEIIKTLIRGTHISGEIKGHDTRTYSIFARLAFTSNEPNPGISRGRDDRGLFQVTSISAAGEGMMPAEFQRRMKTEIAPWYEAFAAFLERDDVRRTYVSILMDYAPAKIALVEDLTHSAMRDAEIARAHLTDKQIVARTILESGVIWGGNDIAMPFRMQDLIARVSGLAKDMGLRRVTAEAVLSEFIDAGLIDRPADGAPYLFKYKIGGLQRLYGDYLGVPLHSQWHLGSLDDMRNDYRDGDAMEPWKGRGK